MARTKAKKVKGEFIEKQLDELKQYQEKFAGVVEESKEQYASNVDGTLNVTDLYGNAHYYEEAFKKIDANRLSTQIEYDKIDKEIEAEHESEMKAEKKEKISRVVAETTINKEREEQKRDSFIDKLLKIL